MRAPLKKPKLIVIEQRVKEARQIVARQQALVHKLRADGLSTTDAEVSLQMYLNALAHLETLRRTLREEAARKKPKL